MTQKTWTQVRKVVAKNKQIAKKTKADIEFQQKVNNKLLVRLLKLANEPKSKKAIKDVRATLNGFDSYEAFKEAVESLDTTNVINLAFVKEFKQVFSAKNISKKYLNWCNYTIYTRATLITSVFAKWFGDKPTRPTVIKSVRKKVLVSAGKTPTGKTSGRKVFKTVIRKMMVKMSNTRFQIQTLKRQRMMMNPATWSREQHGKYGVLRTYAYKLFSMLVHVDEDGEKHRERRSTGYTEDVSQKRKKEQLAQRRARFKTTNKISFDVDWLQKLLQEKKDYYPFATANTPAEIQKQMTLLGNVVKQKAVKEIYGFAIQGDEVKQRELVAVVLQRYPKQLAKAGFSFSFFPANKGTDETKWL